MNHQAQTASHQLPIVQICAWCLPRTIRILSAPMVLDHSSNWDLLIGGLQVQPTPGTAQTRASVLFELDVKGLPTSAYTILRGRVIVFQLSHGICPACHAKILSGLRSVQ